MNKRLIGKKYKCIKEFKTITNITIEKDVECELISIESNKPEIWGYGKIYTFVTNTFIIQLYEFGVDKWFETEDQRFTREFNQKVKEHIDE